MESIMLGNTLATKYMVLPLGIMSFVHILKKKKSKIALCSGMSFEECILKFSGTTLKCGNELLDGVP